MIEIDLTGHVVAVTGAAQGIGAGIVERFAAAGASLVMQYRSTAPSEPDTPSCTVHADLRDDDAPDRIVAAAIDRFGRLDALVNNAAVQTLANFVGMTDAEWDEMLATNLTASHRLTQRFARHAIASGHGGSVVHVASIEGTQPAVGHGHYGVSKAGLLMHTKVAALELGGHGIRVNAVSPGLVDRPGLADDWPDGVSRWLAKAPLGRLGSATDVGDACVFLCSPMARWISGTNLVVDGGVSARSTW
ncbi:MAG: SDR family NAD(P)-dependent oxidoreductase [Acidimicrobiia bacterium]